MEDYTVGIIGAGVVGQSLIKLFESASIPVAVYDPARWLSTPQDAINRCRFAFVCVPTPMASDGSCDTSIVEEVVEWCESDVIVIRSTVAPGTTDRLRYRTGKRIVFQPEYIGETVAHPLVDHNDHGFSVLGGLPCDIMHVANLYMRIFNAYHRFYFCSAMCAELAKYMENAFYAIKVTFCNEFFDIAKAFNVDYNELREVWLADPRISRDHTFVYPDNRGFSGKCLPKDTSAIIAAAHARGKATELLSAVMKMNSWHRRDDETYVEYRELFSRKPVAAGPPAGSNGGAEGSNGSFPGR
jgi:UDPglucose 6-dehydrogenase